MRLFGDHGPITVTVETDLSCVDVQVMPAPNHGEKCTLSVHYNGMGYSHFIDAYIVSSYDMTTEMDMWCRREDIVVYRDIQRNHNEKVKGINGDCMHVKINMQSQCKARYTYKGECGKISSISK